MCNKSYIDGYCVCASCLLIRTDAVNIGHAFSEHMLGSGTSGALFIKVRFMKTLLLVRNFSLPFAMTDVYGVSNPSHWWI